MYPIQVTEFIELQSNVRCAGHAHLHADLSPRPFGKDAFDSAVLVLIYKRRIGTYYGILGRSSF
jgi:hypothetical protein